MACSEMAVSNEGMFLMEYAVVMHHCDDVVMD